MTLEFHDLHPAAKALVGESPLDSWQAQGLLMGVLEKLLASLEALQPESEGFDKFWEIRIQKDTIWAEAGYLEREGSWWVSYVSASSSNPDRICALVEVINQVASTAETLRNTLSERN